MPPRSSLIVSLLLASLAAPAVAADAKLEALEEQAFKQAAALVSPSVVRIQTVGGLDIVGRTLTGTAPTTGVVVSPDGYIVSSAFNFISRPASILVELPDGRRLAAEQVATDRARMLTLLKVESNDLTPVEAADKEKVKVGQWSIAVGRTYDGPEPSLSIGIVSALNRIWGRAVQTDAKVSPVNYGGPLVDIEGNVIGVLVPLSPEGNEETAGVEWYDGGIGFAVPMQDVFAAVERLKSGEDLRPGLLGIELTGRDRLAGEPVIDRVRVDSPAEKAGLKAGDRVTEIDGRPIARSGEIQQALGSKYAGDEIEVAVQRDDETIRSKLTLVGELVPYESGYLGILPEREGTDVAPLPGVGVRHVFADSPAAEAGLKPRDRIVRFNDVEVTDAPTLTNLVGRLRPDERAVVVYRRGDAEETVEVELAAIPNEVPKELRSSVIPHRGEAGQADEDEQKEKEKEEAEAEGPRTGRFTDTLPDREQTYWAYVPTDYNPAYQYGLMVWIHPNDDTMEAAIFRQWKLICDQRGIILLAPKAKKLGGWDLDEAEFVHDAVEHFQQTWSVDPARVFLHGHTSGGTFAYHLAFKHRELFRGVATVAAPLRARPPENHPDFRMQFHLVCGAETPALRLVQATANGLRKLKYPLSLTTVPDRDDKYPAEEEVREIARWADALDRI